MTYGNDRKIRRKSSRDDGQPVWLTAMFVVTFYVSAAFAVFALRHPEMTDTQRLFAFWEVVTWQ